VNVINGGIGGHDGAAPADADTSITNRARSVLAIRAFRRLWGVQFLCSVGDWLSLLALTGLAAKLTQGYTAEGFAFTGVVLTQLLPGLLFAPLGGLFADRFDRRKVMVACDIARCALFFSIAIVGSTLWLFIGYFLIGMCAMLWIPSKDSAAPNLLRRPDQVETANQLGMVMTYGIAVITGAGLYSLITGIATNLNIQPDQSGLGIAKIILGINGLLYLSSAIIVAFRIPELSLRAKRPENEEAHQVKPGFGAMVRDAARFVRTTPLVRGLLVGMIGAFAAAGAVVGSAKLYAGSLRGGEATFGLLFVALFVGLATGMAGSPRVAKRLPHNRLFGIAIVSAGLMLVAVALSPALVISLVAIALVGATAGAAFLTGVTIIGTQVEDDIRGRINAIYQALMKIILAGSMALTPVLVSLVKQRNITVLGRPMQVDGTRPVLLGAGLIAALVGVIAYRQMDDSRTEPILSDLFAALRRKPRRLTGLLIAIEGDTAEDTVPQAQRLAEALRRSGLREVLLASAPMPEDRKLRQVLAGAEISGARAHVLVAAAVRADLVERVILPALDRGAVVVMDRFSDSSLAHLSAAAGFEPSELEGLSAWANSQLRPDLTVLLDRDPSTVRPPSFASPEHQWRVHHLLSEMAAADPDRYVVVDADGGPEVVADRVKLAVQAALAGRTLAVLLDGDRAPAKAMP
jgi:dTMP kinase